MLKAVNFLGVIMSKIIGREPEIRLLDSVYQSAMAEFVAVYGRRRVGKTFLISNYFREKGIYFELVGSKKATLSEQLKNFHREFQGLFPDRADVAPKDWGEAFYRLKQSLEDVKTDQKVIIFLDELPWLASPKSGFLSALEHVWNRYFSRMNNLILVVCGSAASWMLNKVINNKEGLFGRLTKIIPLYPYKLDITAQYLNSMDVLLNHRQIVDIYMCVGGIPKYLSYIKAGQSAVQFINEVFFSSHGQLFLEFPKLYASLFNNSHKHYTIVKALSQKRYGMYQKELLEAVKLPQSGTNSKVLEELESSGFIASIPMFGKTVHDRKFRLIDEYSYFYLNWVEDRRAYILAGSDKNYWEKMFNTASWKAWSGFAFETICFKHIAQIKRRLGISGINSTESHWENEKAQIDLVIDRADDCVNLIEIKFSNSEFSISKDYAEKLRRKRNEFIEATETNKAVFITLITPYGAKKNVYYNELIQSEIILKDLFVGIE